jgi:hypothetical protein
VVVSVDVAVEVSGDVFVVVDVDVAVDVSVVVSVDVAVEVSGDVFVVVVNVVVSVVVRVVVTVEVTIKDSVNVVEPPVLLPVIRNEVPYKACTGVPEITPVATLKLRPSGSTGTIVYDIIVPPVLLGMFGVIGCLFGYSTLFR